MRKRPEKYPHASDGLKTCWNPECHRLGAAQPVSEFFINVSATDGLHNDCRTCTHKISVAKYAKDPDRWRAYTRQWRIDHPEKAKAIDARGNLIARLREAGREGEPYASTSEIHDALVAFMKRIGAEPGRPGSLKTIALCHREPFIMGGACTMDNLFWGWSEINFRATNSPTALVVKLLRDYLENLERGEAV